MKSQCRIIAIVELILGVIGSFILAKGAGINVYAGGRNWTTTIFTFLIGVVVSYVFFVVLYSISEIMDNQEYIMKQLEKHEENPNTSSPASSAKVSRSNRAASLLGGTKQGTSDEEDGWLCAKCGRLNPNGSSVCSCGKHRF